MKDNKIPWVRTLMKCAANACGLTGVVREVSISIEPIGTSSPFVRFEVLISGDYEDSRLLGWDAV
jgi:hypothetical protein